MMGYEIFQTIFITLIVSYAFVQLLRKLIPTRMGRLQKKLALLFRSQWLLPDTENKNPGCSDCASCGTCGSLKSINRN